MGKVIGYSTHGQRQTVLILGTVLEVRPVVTVWVKVRWDNDHDPFDPDQTDWYIASQLDVIQ